MLGSHHVEHALGGIEPGHLVAARRRGGRRGPRSRSRRRAPTPRRCGAVRDDEVDPLAQVVLDDVRRAATRRTRRRSGRSVSSLTAARPGESASIANRSGRTIRRGVRIRNRRIISIIRRPIRIAASRVAGRRGGADPGQVVDGDLDEAGAGGDREQHHLGAGVVAADLHPLGDQLGDLAVEEPVAAADVAEMAGVEEDLDHLRDRPVAPAQEPLHVGAVPDQLARGAGAEDDVALVAEDEQLADVGRAGRCRRARRGRSGRRSPRAARGGSRCRSPAWARTPRGPASGRPPRWSRARRCC